MKQAVIKFFIDDYNKEYTVKGQAINSSGEIVNVGYYSGDYSRAFNEFGFYSDDNGFECQRVIIRKA